MKPSSISDRFGDDYFENRHLNDELRVKQFRLDAQFIKKYCSSGAICDVGCSTGEFLHSLQWHGDTYGMEINKSAIINAKKYGINFDKNILTEEDFFDVVIFRGTIQHVDEPFAMIKKTYESLKPGGYIVFLATPNADSLVYKINHDLPMLDDARNFYIPARKSFCNALTNYGFQIKEVQLPYWNTPYRKFPSDLFKFIINLVKRKNYFDHAFWGNMMSIIAQKPYG